MDILTQLNKAMAYIEAHIDDDIALADVSSVTMYSPYHFGRLFYYIANMPLSEYIRKRKLSLAALKLQSGGDKVIDLAVMYGYDSADSFTRAFVKQHGVTPSNARQPGVNLTIFPPLTFQIKIEGVRAMNWRIEEKEPFEAVGISRFFQNDETGKIPLWWDETAADGSRIKMVKQIGHDDLIGVCEPIDKNKDGFNYMIGVIVRPGDNTSGYKVIKTLKQTWAIFSSDEVDENLKGTEIPELFQRAYSEWLPSSGYERTNGPDFEIYAFSEAGKYYEEVWIPVKKNA